MTGYGIDVRTLSRFRKLVQTIISPLKTSAKSVTRVDFSEEDLLRTSGLLY